MQSQYRARRASNNRIGITGERDFDHGSGLASIVAKIAKHNSCADRVKDCSQINKFL